MRKIERLGEDAMQRRVELLAPMRGRARTVFPARRARRRRNCVAQSADDRGEQYRRNREVEERMLRAPPSDSLQRRVGRAVVVVAVDVLKALGKLRERRFVDSRSLFLRRLRDAVARTLDELFARPLGFRDADNGHIHAIARDHRQQRRKDLLVGQIAGGAEKNQGIGWRHHRSHDFRWRCLGKWHRHRGRMTADERTLLMDSF